ncbi:MAG: stage 0 sporulation family protein [Sumerlaeia bacterium]
MPQVVAIKFYEEMIPRRYETGGVSDLRVQDFVVAYREGGEDVGFVAAVEWVSSEQLRLRKDMLGQIARRASEKEKEAYFMRKAQERKALTLCKTKAEALKLPMKVSTVRIDPRSGKYIFHFTSEQRVDFRNLVKELSEELHGRIELWQIGVRDEAKAIDGFGVCGQQTCCSSWLPEFRPINIRMAKTQDINLPPAKLSGQCGRLLCCLSYEVDQYKEMSKGLLPKGATIKVEGRDGIIIDRNILRQTYVVHFQDGGNANVTAGDLSEVRVPEQMKRMAEVFDRTRKPEKEEVVQDETALDDSGDSSAMIETSNEQEKVAEKKRWEGRGRIRPGGGRGEERQAFKKTPEPTVNTPQTSGGGVDGEQPEEGEEKQGRKRVRNRSRRRGRNRSAAEGTTPQDAGTSPTASVGTEGEGQKQTRPAKPRPPKIRPAKNQDAGAPADSSPNPTQDGASDQGEKKPGRNRRRGGRRRPSKGTQP